MNRHVPAFLLCALTLLSTAHAQQAQRQPPTPAQSIRSAFAYVNGKVLEMAQDFPEDKYDFAPSKEVRTFGAVIVHILSGNDFGARSGRGENVKWDELERDVKSFKSKAEIVAALKKSIDDANATLKATPDARFQQTLSPVGFDHRTCRGTLRATGGLLPAEWPGAAGLAPEEQVGSPMTRAREPRARPTGRR